MSEVSDVTPIRPLFEIPEIYSDVVAAALMNIARSGFRIVRGDVDFTSSLVADQRGDSTAPLDVLTPLRVAYAAGGAAPASHDDFESWWHDYQFPPLPVRHRRCAESGTHPEHELVASEAWEHPTTGEVIQARIVCKGEAREEDLQW